MKQFLFAFSTLVSLTLGAQTTFKTHTIKSEKVEVVDPKTAEDDYQAQLINLEAPSPDGSDYRAFLMRQKMKLREMYPQKPGVTSPQKTNSQPPQVKSGFRMDYVEFNKHWDLVGGIPNDNTLAVSNNGIVLCAINSWVWAYNANTDTTHFEDQRKTLRQIGGGSNSDNNFDPKLIYDPAADRWILVYLQNNTPATSRIKVCFSSTNNPEDPWYSYVLPGNPLNNNRWTDFPAITITEDELFITVNLIIPDVSWQVGFDGSVIWQVNKNEGYAGASTLTNILFSDIKFGNRFIRNLHPVWGATGIAPDAFFLSNRNFDLTNDSIFTVRVLSHIGDPISEIDVKVSKTNTNYGVPPNGRQQDTDLNDPTSGLQTNDARVLGAITNGEWIQFVANTVVPATGFAGIYHGFVTDLYNQPKVTGKIISHPTRDYGYPNIAYTGNENCDIETMIGFNFTAPLVFPGVGAMYFANDSTYSAPVDLKIGENYADRHGQKYERWGDYFGMQRKFNDPKTTWLAGYFGNINKQNTTWVAEVASTDTNKLFINVELFGSALFCDATASVQAFGGQPPYQYSFNDNPFSASNQLNNLCQGLIIPVKVIDARGCELLDTIVTLKTIATEQPAAFPNPFGNKLVAQFMVDTEQNITASIYDESGRLVTVLINQLAKKGQNELIFNMSPLAPGNYILLLEGSAGFKMKQKMVKAI